MAQTPTHHCVSGRGHIPSRIRDFGLSSPHEADSLTTTQERGRVLPKISCGRGSGVGLGYASFPSRGIGRRRQDCRSDSFQEETMKGKRLGKLLLVEDEHRLRGLVALFLRGEGYQVLEAGDGQEGV